MMSADHAMTRSGSTNSVVASSVSTAGRQRWIDSAKGLAIIAVVTYHTLLFLASADVGVADFGRIRIVLEFFPMPAFFVLAGLLQPRMMEASWRQIWSRRLLPFVYLYVLWCAIRFAFFSLFPFVRSDGEYTSGRDPMTLLIAPLVPTSVYWFLWSMFAITLATWLLRRVPPVVLLVATGIVSVLLSSTLVTTGLFAYDRSLQYMFFFVAGVLLSSRITGFVHSRGWGTAAALLAGYAAIGALMIAVPFSRKIPGVVLLGQVCVLLGIFLVLRLTARVPGSRGLAYLGGQSLVIYVLHIYFVAGATVVIRNIPALENVPPRGIPVLVGTTAAVIAASLLVGMLAPHARWLFAPPRWLTRSRRSAVRASAGVGGADLPEPDAALSPPPQAPTSAHTDGTRRETS